ncbi:exopolysaccharide Pel transporter PelG [Thiomonas sp. FB-Cd]|uniref:exopolysaccharide Pel transporter PelG n=1 Tax=Thiomonas sp. FB-Cd TaxID=1158292 RepID=UPI0004DEE876|nr:exopolysaccharide Pel transporter PelG [Thiomonas sp. FB-Cd]
MHVDGQHRYRVVQTSAQPALSPLAARPQQCLNRQLRALGWLAALNVALSRLSMAPGVVHFGYGFAVALLLTLLVGLMLVQRLFRRLEYQTFMLPGTRIADP